MNRKYRNLVLETLEHYKKHSEYGYKGKTLIIKCHASELSKVIGQQKANKMLFRKVALEIGFSDVKIVGDNETGKGSLGILFE